MTQNELAQRIGVTRAAMNRYVKGEREPRFPTLLQISKALDVQVSQLLDSHDDPIETAIREIARTPLTVEQQARIKEIISSQEDL